ncbi:MAG TPA: ATPase, T2SS/T4P/T4SS family, partial [Planctomycetota bacterium]|nr:ATPase, T2SS/T4P/T4SS family [Planctomycetota bacterium]
MDIMQLLNFAIDNGADEALVSAGSPPILRREGKLTFAKMDALTPETTRSVVFQALSPAQIERLENERELSFSFTVREGCQCLGSVYYERGSVSAIFRFAAQSAALPTKLGLPSLLVDATRAVQGFVVVAAPPGHGKSTALNALVETINTTREATVLTLEERIIYPHADKKSVVHQREVGRDTQSFLSALDAAPDQDPDVLVIDPLDDPETIRRALAFAGRGHLVIASMRADYVLEAVENLLGAATGRDAMSVRRQLAASLLLVAALRLLPRNDEPGRVPATEILKIDARVSRLIRDADTKTLERLMNDPDETGTWTMDSFILKLHERGLVDDEA